jgi:hypothetical protein
MDAFAQDWRASRSRHSLAHRLAEFAAHSRPLLPQAESATAVAPRPPLAADLLERAAFALRPLIAARIERGDGINIWSAAGLVTDERRNVGVLARLWMRSNLGDVSTAFLAAFLGRVEGAECTALDEGYQVHTEHRPMGDGAHRVDLVIETRKAIIGIEAKIRAPADAVQLARYEGELKARAAHKGTSCRHVLIFLGPRPREFNCALSATWDDVSFAAREAARSAKGNSRRLLRDFADHISSFRI